VSRFLPVANPPNPFASATFTYEIEDNPGAPLQIFEDHSRSILATNDSPDVGFRWSVNPYRGCFHGCAYCASGDTLVLMADAGAKELREVRVGEEILGTRREGRARVLTRTRVLAQWQVVKPAYRVVAENGTELVVSGDHRLLTTRGWKYVTGTERGRGRRAHLTTSNFLQGVGPLAATPLRTPDYQRGYLCGMIRGDALLRTYRYARSGRAHGDLHQFRLALIDLDGLRRTRAYLADIDVAVGDEFLFQRATATTRNVFAIRTHARDSVDRIRTAVEWPREPSTEWSRGFLAGIFDAEGGFSSGILRISNTDPRILDETQRALRRFGFDAILEPASASRVASNIRIRRGLREHLRFFQLVDPAIRRKRTLDGFALRQRGPLRVAAIEKLGFDLLMYDITTGTEDFVANGIVSHNCYARPSHEYLSFGAGTDFERKIVVKPKAPELLREAFERKSWKGDLVVFSGITDCYQPLEHTYRLTRGCLEVCVDYQNPAGLITKSPIVERDVELLAELARVASCRVSVSIPFWDPEVARAMEPFVTTPERRMKIVETLARAGVPVGVSVSPIVPGLNDDSIPDVLQAAKDAGARHAFFVMLRLPGSVKPVFETALRARLPLRAEKVMRRMREMHGGRVYDSRFGHRGRGEGVYAETVGALFTKTAERLGLVSDELEAHVAPSTFRRPARTGQMGFGF
jgi:DNA repair photolyase